jgi:hypothetical protein
MTLGERLREILAALPEDWSEARVVVHVSDVSQADRAALILGSLTPGRAGSTFRVTISRSGLGAPSADAVRRTLDRLEREGIDARLSLPGTPAFRVVTPEERTRSSIAAAWDEAVATLPPDWSDLYVEVEISSSADVERAALHLSPVNPMLHDGVPPALRFRVAHRFGYGAAPEMARRCLARLDEAGISGRVELLRVLSDTEPVLTQGPVWREGGRSV